MGKPPALIPSNKLRANLQTILVNAKTADQVQSQIPYDILRMGEIIE